MTYLAKIIALLVVLLCVLSTQAVKGTARKGAVKAVKADVKPQKGKSKGKKAAEDDDDDDEDDDDE